MKETAKRLRESASEEVSPWLQEAEWYVKNEDWLIKSARIAAKILVTLKQKGLKQTDLALMLNTSPQHINKIVKGKENLTLETIDKLEKVLGISFNQPILSNPNLYSTLLSTEAVDDIKIEVTKKTVTQKVHTSFSTAIDVTTNFNASISVKPFMVSAKEPSGKVFCKYKTEQSLTLCAA